MDNYVRSLADPFDTSIQQPKFLDGRIDRTAGLRLRTTGSISCNTAGYTYICVIPGVSNVICWTDADTFPGAVTVNGTGTQGSVPTPYNGFMSNATDQAQINRYRLIMAGSRFRLLNSPDESDGMWEAIRINNPVLYGATGETANKLVVGSQTGAFSSLLADMPNNPTYQTGRIRNIDQMLFRLNYRNAELAFTATPVQPYPGSYTASGFNHDAVIIRVRGRQISGQPTMLMYDSVGLYEVEYIEGTALNRLMTYNTVVPNIDELANRLNFKTPALRAE